MDKQTVEQSVDAIGFAELTSPSRIKIEINTSAKGDVNVSATIEAYAGLTEEEALAIMQRAEQMTQRALAIAASAKYQYLDHLAIEEDAAEQRALEEAEAAAAAQREAEIEALIAASPDFVDVPAEVVDEDTSYANGDRVEPGLMVPVDPGYLSGPFIEGID